jgi:8-oxo-dGTP pyrophosphatase MutT (NUDIX family)
MEVTRDTMMDSVVSDESSSSNEIISTMYVEQVKKELYKGKSMPTRALAPPGFSQPFYQTIIPSPANNHYQDDQIDSFHSRSQDTKKFNNYTSSTNKSIQKRTNVLCANCGCMGHIYKNCNHPIISYGIICYKLIYDEELNGIYPKYLMIQRKDSLSYVEFIRGKYSIKAKKYIMDMFSLMTNEERKGLGAYTFDRLWQELWCKNITDDNKSFSKEYKEACDKFNMLKKGYYVRNGVEMTFFSIEYILRCTSSQYNETEWGFPKGRRNINEGDVSCALREFREETGIPTKSVHLSSHLKPLEEVFSGSNKVRYKHVYYIAKMNDDGDVVIDPMNKQQCKEIRNIKWFNYTQAQSKIRETNVERKELFRRLNQLIIKSIS